MGAIVASRTATRGGRAAGRGQRGLLHAVGAREPDGRVRRACCIRWPTRCNSTMPSAASPRSGPRGQCHPAEPPPEHLRGSSAQCAAGARRHDRCAGLGAQRPPRLPRREPARLRAVLGVLHRSGPARQQRPFHVPQPALTGLLSGLGTHRRQHRGHPARRGGAQSL